jgi:hypothetical protein
MTADATAKLRRLARNRIETASLSCGPVLHTWGGRSSGQVCHVCDELICGHEVEFEVEVAAAPGQPLYFHLLCHSAWCFECDMRPDVQRISQGEAG